MTYPIPNKLNLGIACVQLVVLVSLFYAARYAHSFIWVGLLGMAYGITMNSAYATLHEAEHNLFHSNAFINETAGVVMALFFPAPFHLLRQGHLGHHMRNRSDDEAFDYYFEGENAVWKRFELYGILTGLFWIVIFLANFVVLFNPALVSPQLVRFDLASSAFLKSLNPRYRGLIRLEVVLILLTHAVLIHFFQVPLMNYAVMLFSFGFMWSALQYAHHFDTVRDVLKGAKNLKTLWILDWVLMNHNWHLHHHMNPTVPWIYLRNIDYGRDSERESMALAYLKMWRGPKFTKERIENRYAGVIIR